MAVNELPNVSKLSDTFLSILRQEWYDRTVRVGEPEVRMQFDPNLSYAEHEADARRFSSKGDIVIDNISPEYAPLLLSGEPAKAVRIFHCESKWGNDSGKETKAAR